MRLRRVPMFCSIASAVIRDSSWSDISTVMVLPEPDSCRVGSEPKIAVRAASESASSARVTVTSVLPGRRVTDW